MGFFDLFKRQARAKPSASIMQSWVQEWEKRQGVTQPRNFAEELATYSHYVWAWVCAKKVADSLTTLPLRFWRKGGKAPQEITSGPLPELFEYANDYSTLRDLLFITSLDLQFCGNAYWHLGTAEGPAEKLERIPPQRLKAKPGENARIESWLLTTSATNQRLEAGEVLHFRQPDPNNDIYGIGAAAGGAISIDTDMAAAETNKDLLERDIRIGGILNVKGRIQTAEERRAIAKRFEQEHGGRGPGKHVLVVNAEEAAFVPTQFTLRDMEFAVLRRMLRVEVCAAFGVPPPLVGIYENSALNTALIDAAGQVFWGDTMQAHARIVAGTLTEFLLPRYGLGLYAEFDFSMVEALRDTNLDDRTVALKEIELGVLGEAEYRSIWYPDLTGPPPAPKPVPAALAPSPTEEPLIGEESGAVPFGQRRLSPRGSGATRFGPPSIPPPGNGKSASDELLKSLSEQALP